MYLKSLILQGFKSFPNSIKLEFNKGITSVVGPNGSGKSNVSDAIRWVIGEQSAKNLRGAKMEDIIFAGTENRKSLGFAEVSMIIDNSDKFLKLDYPEIKITRRVMRSGESNYSINDVNCRLKDVQELFMDTGIGREGYSIIGQGKIEEILKSKSDERRLLFEEATGIVKYKSRKKEAEHKLERERQNLIRLSDIILELEKQVLPLKNQATIAREYLSLSERKKSIDINLFVHDVKLFEESKEKINSIIKVYNEELTGKEKEYSDKELLASSYKTQIKVISDEIESLKEELSQNKTNIIKNENIINVNNEKLSNFQKNNERINLSKIEKENNIKKMKEEINDFNLNISLNSELLLEATAKLNEKKENFDKLNASLSNNEYEYDIINKKIIDNITQKTNIASKIEHEEAQYIELEEKKEVLIEQKKILLGKEQDKKIAVEVEEKRINEVRQNIENTKNAIRYLDGKSKENKEISYNIYNELDSVNKDFQEKSANVKVLKQLEKSYEGYFDSVKYILQEKEKGNSLFDEVCCVVGQAISVKKEWETAIEISIGGAIQNVITTTEKGAKRIIENLKVNKKGRATFLPINKVKRNNFTDTRLLKSEGVIGLASEIVEYDSKYEPVISNLLGKIIIVDNLDNGILLANSCNYSYRIVTLEGDVLSTGGAITGGSASKKRTNIFSRSRELAEYEKLQISLKEKVDKLQNEYQNSELSLKKFKEELSEAREKLSEYSIILSESTNIYDTLNVELKHIRQDVSNTIALDFELTNNIVSKNKLVRELIESLQNYAMESSELEKRLENYKRGMEASKDERDIHVKELIEFNGKISKLQDNINFVKENKGRVDKLIKDNEKEIATLNKELEMNLVQSTNNDALVAEIKLQIKQIIENNVICDHKIVESVNKKNELEKVFENLLQYNKELFMAINVLKNSLVKEESKLESQIKEVNVLYDNMWNEHEITYNRATQFTQLSLTYGEMKNELSKINGKIKELGNINMNAIDEFDNINERYEFLLNQRNDIQNGEEKLNLIIDDLTKLMTQQFMEQFEMIRKNFQEVFVEMFEGGHADLVLLDESDILSSGIDIVAQPPGKKLVNITLLSGGEKAMTAIALLFGILLLKPSPFCILDEIEAALDDANVNRYAKYLKKFSQNTQFIIITHRKGTMEIADVLYGVTMEEMGVSKLVSVKFAQ